MRKDVKKYVASCSKCQRRKSSNIRRQGYTKPLPIAEDIFDTIGIDLINKLPRSNAGYNTILVITDNLSKYVVTAALKDEKAETITFAIFTNFIARFGCPKIVISDRGLNISGQRSRDFYKLYGIKRHLTSAYHPQSNGQTERFNRTLSASLTMYVEKNQKNWSDYLAALTFAYNITEHSVTNVAPYELIFGRRPRIPLDNLLNRDQFIDPKRPLQDIRSYAALELMKKAISESQQTNKSRLDARLSPNNFNVGDLVLFERPTRVRGQIGKLTYVYTGPYKISRKLGEVTFELVAQPSCTDQKITRVVHPCSLKRYVPRIEEVIDEAIDPDFVPREPCELTQDQEPNERRVDSDKEPEQPENEIDSISTLSAFETCQAIDSEEEIESPAFEPLTPPRANIHTQSTHSDQLHQ